MRSKAEKHVLKALCLTLSIGVYDLSFVARGSLEEDDDNGFSLSKNRANESGLVLRFPFGS